MAWKPWLRVFTESRAPDRTVLRCETLESRDPGATASLAAGGALTVTGSAGNDHILIRTEGTNIVVLDQKGAIGKFSASKVTSLKVRTLAGNDLVKVAADIKVPATLDGGIGKNLLEAGGGVTTIIGGGVGSKIVGGGGANTLTSSGSDQKITGGSGSNTVTAGGSDKVVRVTLIDPVTATPTTKIARNNTPPPGPPPEATLTSAEVGVLLQRAAAASASQDAIIAIVDRNGTILGVRTEGLVAPEVNNNVAARVFAIDGAVSLARTGAFFGSNQAPLTSRTIRSLSQSTITEREVNSNPNIPDVNSTLRGPGFVAPVGVGAHFPTGIPNTPPVDLFGIEHTNRDGSTHPGKDGVLGTADDIPLANRFNIKPAFVPKGQTLTAPDSYGVASGLLKSAQSRGIATLPGGIPLVKYGQVVGGIGVFFPGKTGFATEENSVLSTTFDPTRPDRSLEAEFIAFAAAGGSTQAQHSFGTINGVGLPDGFDLPFGRIDLVGITLDLYGPGGSDGVNRLVDLGKLFGVGSPNSGVNRPVAGAATLLAGKPVPVGWLVTPHNGVGITAAEVQRIIENGIAQADRTRAAIRLPANSTTRMVFAVADRNGEVVGLFRMPDATVFSIDVAVAKARNVNYYADPAKLQASDRVAEVPPGVAFTNRTFRFLSLPRFPSGGPEGQAPAPFSILKDGGSDIYFGLQVGPRLPAKSFQSVYGHDSFFPGTNFHDPTNIANQNGIVFFPGSAAVYRPGFGLIGGFGASGDGVDQDDVVTASGVRGFEPVLAGVPKADQAFVAGVRLPYQKFDRNPEGF